MNPPDMLVLCNEAASARHESDSVVKLRTYGPHRNVRLKLDHLGSQLSRDIPTRLVDLVEIAAMVYIADQVAHRGAHDVESMGACWRRHLHFEIPVRDHRFWVSAQVRSALVDLLSFLSEDSYEFTFSAYRDPPALDRYLDFGTDAGRSAPRSVILFSGGLDSLGGVVEKVVGDGERAILVSHESSPKLRTRLRALRGMIDAAAGDAAPEHVTVTVNKEDLKERDYTQRSRSFLYASLATAVARMAGLDAIRFFENGIVSLNLPLSPQIIGSRATRTTHPKVLAGMRTLFSLVTECSFGVTNDFIWKTKSDVVRSIVDAGHGGMIPLSTSCTHTWEMRNDRPHCGACSQCIDRRFAVLGGGASQYEKPGTYGCDLLVGERPEGESRIMLASYVETAQQVASMSDEEFFSRYGEAARALRHVGLPEGEAARRIVDLYKRHAAQVMSVIDEGVAKYGAAIRSRSLSESCLLRLVQDPRPSSGSLASGGGIAHRMKAQPRYKLERLGEGWDLWFDGRRSRLLPKIGVDYLEHLIRCPQRRFSVAELFVAVRPSAANIPVAKGEPILDKVALSGYMQRLQEIAEERDKADRNGDHAYAERLDRDKEILIAELKAAGFAGRPRTQSADQKKLRDRVCNTIARSIKSIGKYDIAAGAHFSEFVSTGSTVVYSPRVTPEWEFG